MRSYTYTLLALMLVTCTFAGKSQSKESHSDDPKADVCGQIPNLDHPNVALHNGKLNAVFFLPDKEKGFYRASRFDWGGIVGCVSLNGHTFFGEWFRRYDPMINDAVVGPAEEFRSPVSELGYDAAAPGGHFVKVGVGVLQRVDNSPYRFGGAYPAIDIGERSTKVRRHSITFRQVLRTDLGIAYVYEKTLSLDGKGNVLSLKHKLKNIGTQPINTAVYDHDFFMLDHNATGPGMEIHLPFVPVPDAQLPSAVQVEGKTIKFVSELGPKGGVGAYLTGYSNQASDYDILFEDTQLGIGVEQTSRSAISKFYLWATPKTVCPEAYIAIHVLPGKTQEWTINYRFLTALPK
jgi:hypothetical protein